MLSSAMWTRSLLSRSARSSLPSRSSSLLLSRSSLSTAAAAAPPSTIKVNVDGRDVDIPTGFTVLQACEQAGVHVPRFCYHDRLSVAGNCRMCLVEVEKVPKPVASCAYPTMPNMKIKTDSPLVHKAREGVMEFLLANHPLDCPICDQGGECDLQDQSMVFGSDRSRFREYKRAVEDKNLGPLVKTVMTRCIHCTRCVRFTREICGITTLGTTGRGNNVEIGTYVDALLDTELSGNVIDLCPVGALTSKPYAFTARPWELIRTESIDVLDAVGSAIRVDTRGPEVMRILPRLHEDVNEEWIGDKSRFSYDGLKRQRLDQPLIRQGDKFVPATWSQALAAVRAGLASVKGGHEVLGVVGEQADAEGIIALKDLLTKLGSNNFTTTQHAYPLSTRARSDYLFNSTIAGIEAADVLVLVGTNPRMEAPVIGARIRKSVRQFGLRVASIGPAMDLNLPHKHLGDSTATLVDLATGKHAFAATLKAAKRPMIVLGISALQHQGIHAAVAQLRAAVPQLVTPEWNGINILHTAASRVATLDLGFVPTPNSSFATPSRFVYLLGAESVDPSLVAPDAFIVYAGSHGDAGAERANVVLPAPAYTEKNGTYVNMEGRVQRTKAAVSRLPEARDDWQILRAVSEVVGAPLPYSTVDGVRQRLVDVAPHFAQLDEVSPDVASASASAASAASAASPSFADASALASLKPAPFTPLFTNYFFTDPISRASAIMSKCAAQLPTAKNSYKA